MIKWFDDSFEELGLRYTVNLKRTHPLDHLDRCISQRQAVISV